MTYQPIYGINDIQLLSWVPKTDPDKPFEVYRSNP